MAQWGLTDNAANSVIYVANTLMSAANNSALFGNTSLSDYVTNQAVGQFGVSAAEMANTTGEAARVAHAGWQLRRAGTGPVTAFTVTAPGAGIANGETITVTDTSGSASPAIMAVGIAISNATGNLVSVSIANSGLFVNTTAIAITFNKEKHIANVTVTGSATGYSNTDTIRVSNGSVNATATMTTNSIGGVSNSSFVITNVGLFANVAANSNLVVTALAANGSASAGSGATFSVKVANSTDANVSVTLGGRAGRVTYETIVAMGSLSNGSADDTYFPQ